MRQALELKSDITPRELPSLGNEKERTYVSEFRSLLEELESIYNEINRDIVGTFSHSKFCSIDTEIDF